MQSWRRISDWKRELTVVSLADVDRGLIDARGWALPAERIADRWPRLAALSREVGIARVDASVAKVLRSAGVVTHDFGYHRGSDGWGYRRRGADKKCEGLTGELVAELMDGDEDDEKYDRLSNDVVDAILRVCSDGVLGERAVIVAAELPTLAEAREALDVDALELDRLEALGSEGLPAGVDADLLASVRARVEAGPVRRQPTAVEARTKTANIRKALGTGVVLALGALFLRERAPTVAAIVFALALSALLIALLAKVLPSGR